MFADRADAARKLLEHLPKVDPAASVVLALPRGGVPIAAPIARSLGAPLDLVLVRKVGAPGHPEIAVGAISDSGAMQLVVNRRGAEAFGLSEDAVRSLAETELPELDRRRRVYMRGREPLPLGGKNAILVDDGIATGATVEAALRVIRQQDPTRIILAVPVAPPDVLSELSEMADDIICPEKPIRFGAVGAYYHRFDQVSDEEVLAYIEQTDDLRERALRS